MNKTLLIPAGLIMASLALAGCQKSLQELAPEVQPESDFTIIASAPSTRTANDGLSTKWVAEDAINIFHAAAETADYKKDGKFTVSDVESGKFSGSLSETLSGASYDWYALYPYSASVASPASKDGYITVAAASQSQSGNGSKAHLAGENFPLWGKTASVDVAKAPTFKMSQLASVAMVRVSNNSSAPLTVSSVKLTATEAIAGEFAIDFTGDAPAYTPKASAVSSEVTLSVSGGTAIAVGESADFFIALKPFTAKSGTVLKLAVNGFENQIALSKDFDFAAGRIKEVTFNYRPKIVIDQKYASSTGYRCAVNEKSLTLSSTVPSGHTVSEIVWKSSDESIATVSGGVVTYAGGFGDVTITAEIAGVESGSIALSVPCGLFRETFHNEANCSITHGGSDKATSVWHDGYLEITTGEQDAKVGVSKQRADFTVKNTKNKPVMLHAGNYPILAFKVDQVKELYNLTQANLKPDIYGKTVIGNVEYRDFAGNGNNYYVNDLKCSDGSHVYVYDFTKQTFKNNAKAPTDEAISCTTYQIKYADIQTATGPLTYKLYWLQTFESLDAVKAYIENVDGLTYSVVK